MAKKTERGRASVRAVAIDIEARDWETVDAALLELNGNVIADAALRVRELSGACEAALAWLENMRIVPGGDRDRLRIILRKALRKPVA